MEDAEESWEICADELFIRDQFLHCFGGSLEQGRVGSPLVLTDESAQTLRDGKGDEEMMTGELPFHLLFEPQPGFMMLTGRAMAISTGAIDPM